ERRLGHVHRGAARAQRLGDRGDRVLVLLEVLAGAGKRCGQGEVMLVVAGTADSAGEYPGGDQAALAAYEHLWRRAEQPVDVERPAQRVSLDQTGQWSAYVEGAGELGDQVAGEDDLVEVAGADAADGLGDDVLPPCAGDRAVGEDD